MHFQLFVGPTSLARTFGRARPSKFHLGGLGARPCRLLLVVPPFNQPTPQKHSRYALVDKQRTHEGTARLEALGRTADFFDLPLFPPAPCASPLSPFLDLRLSSLSPTPTSKTRPSRAAPVLAALRSTHSHACVPPPNPSSVRAPRADSSWSTAHSFGMRARTRDMFKRGFKTKGMIPLSTFLRVYKVGDIVDIKANAAQQKGMPHKYYHGYV